jgi:hypothetical protein
MAHTEKHVDLFSSVPQTMRGNTEKRKHSETLHLGKNTILCISDVGLRLHEDFKSYLSMFRYPLLRPSRNQLVSQRVRGQPLELQDYVLLCPPSKMDGHIVIALSVRPSAGFVSAR